MTDVFISYSRADKERVAQLAAAIESEGYDVWWDEELPPHMSYGDVITDKIENAKAAVVVWSADASKSEWVRAEADAARNHKKLIQTALADIIPPLPFNQIQCANLADWNGEEDHPGWRKVKQSLVALCGEREGKAAAAAPLAETEPAPPLSPTPAPEPTPTPAVTAPIGAAAAAETPPPAPPSAPQPATEAKKGHSPAIVLGALGGLAVLLGLGALLMGGDDDKPADADAEAVALMDATGDGGDGETDASGKPEEAIPAPDDRQVAPPPAPLAREAQQQPPAQQQDAYNRDVTLINQSGEVVMYMYWSNTDEENWGPDQLGTDVWPDGQSANVTIDDGTGACNFDFMAITSSGREIVRPNVNVCGVYEIYFN